jgi:hypothetical protein
MEQTGQGEARERTGAGAGHDHLGKAEVLVLAVFGSSIGSSSGIRCMIKKARILGHRSHYWSW